MKHRNKVLIAIAIAFMITAAAFLILGFALSGYDILGWFGSKWAMLFYMMFGVYAIVAGYFLIGDRLKRL